MFDVNLNWNKIVFEGVDNIRKYDKDIPFILTTAHAESEYLLKAISLNVRHYAIKPLQIRDIMLQIQDICEIKFNEQIIKKQQEETTRYINIINQVAIVLKLDLNKNITYVNDNFCKVSKYTRINIWTL